MQSYVCFDGATLPHNVGSDGPHGSRVSDGKAGHLCFGPYVTLDPGFYVAGFYVRALPKSSSGEVTLDVAVAGGGSLAHKVVRASELFDDTLSFVAMEFEIGTKTDGIEVRAFVHAGVLVEIVKLVVFSRRAIWGGG